MKAKGVPDSKIDDFIANCNYIGNLQLLEQIPNIEKKAMDFDVFLEEREKLLVKKLEAELRKG